MSLKVKRSGTQGSGLKKLIAGIDLSKGVKGYKVGWPASATYPDGQEVAAVALWNEFGVPENNLPERPFFRQANKKFSGQAAKLIRKFAENGKITKRGNEKLAQRHVSMVKMQIRDLKEPPNTPETIAAKGSSNPLIDTGLMRRTVDYEPLK